MGTNYYLHTEEKNKCEHCGRADHATVQHIGKSSGGWCFSLHVVPEEGINDLDDWRALWKEGRILDEYGNSISIADMEKIITERSWGARSNDFDYARNHAEPGPHGLVRHSVGQYCIKQGAGTWDCMIGDFS